MESLLRRRAAYAAFTLLLAATAVMGGFDRLTAQAQVRSRWLEIRRMSGQVTYQRSSSRSASLGDRLQAPGHGVRTGRGASAVLALDDGVGVVNVAERTQLSVRRLETLSNGASVTVLAVPRGQARLNVRRFTNPSSRLELHTPSGVIAVRGTEFGVSASPGKTQVGTLEGAVTVSAQGEAVQLIAGTATVILEGEPPLTPQALDRELRFSLIQLYRQGEQLLIEGRVNPTNAVFLNGQELTVSLEGQIQATVTDAAANSVTLTIRNPLGEAQDYRLVVQ